MLKVHGISKLSEGKDLVPHYMIQDEYSIELAFRVAGQGSLWSILGRTAI